MKFKHLFTTFGLATILGLGIFAGLSTHSNIKQSNASTYGTEGAITVYFAGVDSWTDLSSNYVQIAVGGDWNNTSASQTSGAEFSIGQFKKVYATNSTKTSLNCYFYNNNNEYRHPAYDGVGDSDNNTNYSTIDIGSITLTPGHSYAITFTGWAYNYNDWSHAWFSYTFAEVEAPDQCLIKGTVGELSMSSDTTGQFIGSFNNWQFEITNLHLVTTDSCYFAISGWFNSAGYSMISGDGKNLFDSTKSNLVPLANGYYNFYIQKTAMYVTKTEVEDVDDGVYLRHSTDDMATNVTKFTEVTANSVYRLSGYSLTSGISYKAVKYVDGLMTWCEINNVTCGDENYFNVSKSGGNVLVSTTGKYTITVTSSGSSWNYEAIDTASAWCREFLDSMTCTQSGTSVPVFKTGYSWTSSSASYSTSFNELDDIAKNAIYRADAHDDGSVIQEAVSRYDTIVSNHGFVKFIKNSSDVLRASNEIEFSLINNNDTNVAVIIVIVSSISLIALGGFFFIRKRKEDR